MKTKMIDVLVFMATPEYDCGIETVQAMAASEDRASLEKLKKRLEKAARKAMREIPGLLKTLDHSNPSDRDLANLGFEVDEYPVARAFCQISGNAAIVFHYHQVPLIAAKGA